MPEYSYNRAQAVCIVARLKPNSAILHRPTMSHVFVSRKYRPTLAFIKCLFTKRGGIKVKTGSRLATEDRI